jgi:hypothetical protein
MSDRPTSATLPPLTGGCLCGRVRYEATPDHRQGYYCHCRMCQLALGNTRASYINLRKSELRWLSAANYFASSKIARRGFCSTCGTPLSFEYLDSDRMDLSVGSLDDPTAVAPTLHYAIESRIANWHAEDGLPGERLDANERIQQRWRDAYGDVPPGLDTTRSG